MLDDFFIRALLAGVGIALITGPLGCFVIWRRLSFFAGTLAHSALLGVTMALVFELNIAFSVFLISAVLAIFLLQLQTKTNLPNAGMILHKVEELGLSPIECAMVGDRLYTDMEMADRAGVHGVLVLSGEATREDLEAAPQNPSLVVGSIAELC